jgi:hypothetical protein
VDRQAKQEVEGAIMAWEELTPEPLTNQEETVRRLRDYPVKCCTGCGQLRLLSMWEFDRLTRCPVADRWEINRWLFGKVWYGESTGGGHKRKIGKS